MKSKRAINKLQEIGKEAEEEFYDLYRSYRVSVGWTTKYRNALAEANKRLIKIGEQPVSVIGNIDEDEQLKFL